MFYQKYRPQTFQQLIGQSTVVNALVNAFVSNKLSHAYLFAGPRGTGKTTTARLLAKLVNCQVELPTDPEQLKASILEGRVPCNSCTSCESITNGSNMDVLEIDAASNRGIDDIRSLRETIKLSPSNANKKVYIIDEVHMLSNEAFSALLKTLEEPPKHVLFILATTEAQKIPDTIKSRVSRLDFHSGTNTDIEKAIKHIAELEQLELEEGVITELHALSEGGFRDAEKLLDQLAATSSKISLELLRSSLSLGSNQQLDQLLNAIFQRQTPQALELLAQILDQNVSPKNLTTDILQKLRQILLQISVGTIKSTNFEVSDLNQVLSVITAFQECFESLRYSSIPVLSLEVAIIKSTQISQTIKQSVEVQSNVLKAKESDQTITKDKVNIQNIPDEKSISTADDNLSFNLLQEKWSYILDTVLNSYYSLGALLRSCVLSSVSGELVQLEVPYAFHQRMLQNQKNRDVLESIFSEIVGAKVILAVVVNPRAASIEELANVELAADDEIVRIASEIFNS